jgi:organic radical activating enzyme
MPSNRFPMGSNIKDYWSHERLKNIQDKLLNDQKPEECQWCWKNEENGLKSHRISHRRDVSLHSMHLRLNNVCNFKCRMCGPAFSSSWAQENTKHGFFEYRMDIPDKFEIEKDALSVNAYYLFPLLKKYILAGQLKHLSISGGEPLITDANYKLLTFLIDNKLTNVTLSYSTNLSNLSYKGIDLLSLWSKFDKVSLEVSLDGWGEAVEYSRTGLNLDKFKENFVRAFKYIDAINCVVNVYSVWTLPYIEKFRKKGLNIVYSPCYLPAHCNSQILLREDKDEIKKLYSGYPHLKNVYENFIDKDLDEGYTVEEIDKIPLHYSLSDLRKKMVSFNLLLDKYRDTNFFKTFPQYEKYKEQKWQTSM